MASNNTRIRGFTLIEIMVAMAIATMIIGSVTVLFLYCSKAFASMTNHVDMSRMSQNTMDNLSQQIRRVNYLTAYSTNSVTFQDYDGNPLQFVYDSGARTLSRIKQGATNVFLTDCDALQFQIYQELVASNSLDVTTAAGVTNCKVVVVNWSSSRMLVGTTNSDELQCAKIVIRNKH